MADLNYTLSIDDQRAIQSLKNVQTQVRGTTEAFRGLGTAIAALATGAFATQAFAMATALNNLSNSTGIALENVVGFGQALQASGGTIDRAVDGISDLVKNVGDAARGSKELQNAFSIAGVSLEDLRTLSEQDILRKTVAGLAAIPDSARRTSTAMQIMGESVKGVDLTNLNRQLDGFTQRAGPNAAAIKSAADAQRNFATASQNLQVELLAALKPISELSIQITNAAQKFSGFIEIIVKFGVALASITIIGKLLSMLGGGIAVLVTAIAGLKAGVGGLAVTFGSFLTQIRAVIKYKEITAQTVEGLRKRFHYLGQELPLLGKGLAALGVLAAGAWEAVTRLFEADSDADNQSAAETKRLQAMNDRAKAQDQVTRQVIDGNMAELKTIRDGITAYQQSAVELQRRIGLQTSLLRATEEQRFAVETIAEAEQNYLKAIEPLTRRIQEIRAKGKNATADELRLIPEMESAIRSMSNQYQQQLPALQALIQARIQELQITKELELASQALLRQEQVRETTSSAVSEIILQGQQRVNDAYNEAETSLLPGIQSQLRKIVIEENRIATAAKRRIAEQMGDNTQGLEQALREIDVATESVIRRRQEAASSVYNEQRSFATGWQRAFAEYADAATNAATQAQTIFQKTTRGMEDALVNFAKTGKLNFRSLVADIAETILRSQIQQLIARAFTGGSTGGGGGGILNTILGAITGSRAAGGPVSAGRAYRVGESGPETFVPTGSGSIIPGAGSTVVTYNINAVDAASFKAMIAADPSFLFAVTEQGRRSLPQGRR